MAELAYSIVETAKLLGCCKDTVYAMVKQNRIPNRQIASRRWIIPKVALEKWLAEAPFEDIRQPLTVVAKATTRSIPRMQIINGIKHPAVKPGCGGRKRKTTA